MGPFAGKKLLDILPPLVYTIGIMSAKAVAERDFVKSEVLEDLAQFRDVLQDHISCLTPNAYHTALLGEINDTLEKVMGAIA